MSEEGKPSRISARGVSRRFLPNLRASRTVNVKLNLPSANLPNPVSRDFSTSGPPPSYTMSADNPRFRSVASRGAVSTSSSISHTSSENYFNNDTTADADVTKVLQAKQKAVRKNGLLAYGPSVQMSAHASFKQNVKPEMNGGIFRRMLPDRWSKRKNGKTQSNKKFSISNSMGATTKNTRVSKASRRDWEKDRERTERTQSEIDLIAKALKSLLLLNQLSDITIERLAMAMVTRKVKVNEVICKQGHYGDEMYVISSGSVSITEELSTLKKTKKSIRKAKSKSVKAISESTLESVELRNDIVLTAGSAFGELALHFGSPRERTITATEPCTLFVLDRHDFRKAVEHEFIVRNDFVFDALRKVKILDKLKPEQIRNIQDLAELVSFPPGKKIIEKGSLAGTFYMIIEGSVDCIVYEVDNIKSDGAVQPSKDSMLESKSKPSDVTTKDSTTSIEGADIPNHKPTAAIFAQQSIATTSSQPRRQRRKKVYHYGAGEYFGERGLLQEGAVRKADVIASTEVMLLAITYETLSEHLSGLLNHFEENIKLQALEDTPLFDSLNREDTTLLRDALEVKSFKHGDFIVSEGVENSSFFIIREGEVHVKKKVGEAKESKQHEVTTIKKDGYFGEGSLLLNQLPNASVVAKGEVACFVLSKENFKKFITGAKFDSLQHAFNERNRRTNLVAKEKRNEILADVKLNDLKVITTLGSGCFGLVKLAQVPKLNSFFALKILEKGAVVRNNQEINVINEKNILLDSDHPFIVSLHRTFKDKRYLYFLMEFIQGGEMFQFLHHERNGHLDNATARFFVAGVVDALDYLHKKRICYRDLKPENLMIDKDGYAKMVDFGFAKELEYKTFTLCGTAQYLAPEILSNNGYNRSIDFWCLGILIYELFTGTTPFKRNNRNALFKAIRTENKIKFNRRWKDADAAKGLVCLLLHKSPRKRLGCGTTRAFKAVKEHEWFKDMDFQKLYYKELPPPWLPKLKKPNDVSHFEEYDEDDNPLTGKYDHKCGNSELWKDF